MSKTYLLLPLVALLTGCPSNDEEVRTQSASSLAEFHPRPQVYCYSKSLSSLSCVYIPKEIKQ